MACPIAVAIKQEAATSALNETMRALDERLARIESAAVVTDPQSGGTLALAEAILESLGSLHGKVDQVAPIVQVHEQIRSERDAFATNYGLALQQISELTTRVAELEARPVPEPAKTRGK